MDFNLSGSWQLKDCIQCGMCLPQCPTYKLTQKEKHSPRGRLFFMKQVEENPELNNAAFEKEMNYCLGCLSCQYHCPAGIPYGQHLEKARQMSTSKKSIWNKMVRKSLLSIPFQNATLLKALCSIGNFLIHHKIFRSFWKNIPFPTLRKLIKQFPSMSFKKYSTLKNPPHPSHSVYLHPGCVQKHIFPKNNQASINVLRRNNYAVKCSEQNPCCGSLQAHNGDLESARKLAQKNLDSIDFENVDFIVSNAGGCASHLKKYPTLFKKSDPYYSKALKFSEKLRDIHEVLNLRELKATQKQKQDTFVAFHDSCHLKHALKVEEEPRALLKQIPQVQLQENPQKYDCCGAAGIYSFFEAETAEMLSQQKFQDLKQKNVQFILTTNPGCQMILNSRKDESAEQKTQIMHTMEFLELCYQGKA